MFHGKIPMSVNFTSAKARAGRSGFTLIELLVVISVMAVLGTIVLGSSRVLVQTSRVRRSTVTREALNVAMNRYRTEYQQWPVSRSEAKNSCDKHIEAKDSSNGYDWYEWSKKNYVVFDALRANNNTDSIRFIDETAIFTDDDNHKPIPLSSASGSSGHSLCYVTRRTNKAEPFTVRICFDTDECIVGPDSFKDQLDSEEEDDEDAKY